jgi:O-antigen/teichoic acid export membrane protein
MTGIESAVQVETTESSVSHTRIAHAFSIQLVCRAVGMLASVVSVAMTARYLGPGRYGQLTAAVVFVGMWISFADLGISTVIVRRVTAGRGALERLVRVNSGLSLVYCVPLAAIAAVSGLLVYHDPAVRIMIVMLSGWLLMLTVTTCFEPVFLANVQFAAVAVSDVAGRLGTLAIVTWLVSVHADVIWFGAAQLIPFALQLLIQGVAAARQISVRPIFSPPEAVDLLRETLPLAAVTVLAILYWRADGVILSLVSTHSEVGVYGLAYTIAFNTAVVSTFFLKSTLSTATELFARDVTAFAGFMRRCVELMYFAAIPVAVVGVLLAGPLVGFFGDRAFVARGTSTMALLFVAVALRFVTGALGQGLFACHQQGYLLKLFIGSLVLNVALNLALDGRFGAVGAGVALVCTELFGMAFASWWLRRQCGYRTPLVFMLRVLVPTAASVVVVLLLSGVHVLLVVTVAAAAYLATSLGIGPVKWSTVAAMRAKKVIA